MTDVGAPLGARPEILEITVRSCARCGGAHEKLPARRFQRSCEGCDFWAPCPTTGDPILVGLVVAGVASEAGRPRCKHYLWAVSCGDTSCELHGAWEAKWSGRGASPEREADFQTMVLGASPAELLSVERLAELLFETDARSGRTIAPSWSVAGEEQDAYRDDAAWLLPRLGAVPGAPSAQAVEAALDEMASALQRYANLGNFAKVQECVRRGLCAAYAVDGRPSEEP